LRLLRATGFELLKPPTPSGGAGLLLAVGVLDRKDPVSRGVGPWVLSGHFREPPSRTLPLGGLDGSPPLADLARPQGMVVRFGGAFVDAPLPRRGNRRVDEERARVLRVPHRARRFDDPLGIVGKLTAHPLGDPLLAAFGVNHFVIHLRRESLRVQQVGGHRLGGRGRFGRRLGRGRGKIRRGGSFGAGA
jgi:hypothetical protein